MTADGWDRGKFSIEDRRQHSAAHPSHPSIQSSTDLVADGPQEVEAVHVVELQVRRQPRHHLHGVLHPSRVHLDARAAEVLVALCLLFGKRAAMGQSREVGRPSPKHI